MKQTLKRFLQPIDYQKISDQEPVHHQFCLPSIRLQEDTCGCQLDATENRSLIFV